MTRFSEDLKRAREIKGVSIQDISKETRINPKFIEALEDGNYKILPQTYIRAFIRAYAKCVGLNPEETLERYQYSLSGKNIPDSTTQASITPQPAKPAVPQEKEIEDPTLKKLEEYLISVKTKPAGEEIKKEPDQKDDTKSKPAQPKQKKKVNIANLIIVFGAVILFAFLVYYYFTSSHSNNDVKENSFDNVLKEAEEKYTKKSTNVSQIRGDSSGISAGIIRDSLTLSLITDMDAYISVVMDSKRYDRSVLPANSRRVLRAKEKFIVTAPRGKHIKIYLDDKYLGNLSNTDSLKSVYVTPEGIKSRKLEKKNQPVKPDELKPLELKPINRTLFR